MRKQEQMRKAFWENLLFLQKIEFFKQKFWRKYEESSDLRENKNMWRKWKKAFCSNPSEGPEWALAFPLNV